jgi:DNA-binding MarR family transcriptional regulator
MRNPLQREIKQTTAFRSLEAEVFVNVLRTSAALVSGLADLLRPYDLTQPQYNVLRILRGAGAEGLLRGEVGERMVARDPDVTRLLDRMEARGQVSRERGVDDRRMVHVRISAEGMRLVNTLDEPVQAMHARQLGHLTEAELTTLNTLLVKARAPATAE